LAERGLVALAELPALAGADRGRVDATLAVAVAQGLALRGRAVAWAPDAWLQAKEAVLRAVAAHHRAEPLAAGMPAQLARAAVRGAGVTAQGEAALAALGADRGLLDALVRLGVLVRLPSGLFVGKDALDRAVASLRRAFPDGRPFTAADAKQAMATTRKTAI